jgi:hypothetical protein
MLEKLNAFVRCPEKPVMLKHVVDRQGAEAEVGTLMELNSMAVDSSIFSLKVPALYPGRCTLYSVAMAELTGIRLLDTLALVNEMTEGPSTDGVARRASQLKDRLVENSLEGIALFQSDQVQDRLRRRLGTLVAVYDYSGKLIEALEYVQALYFGKMELDLDILEEVDELCRILSGRAKVIFRDGSLKNRMVVLPQPKLSGGISVLEDGRGVSACFRPSEQPWTDPGPILDMIRRVDVASLMKQIYDVDFESSFCLTVPSDDYFHVLLSEVVGFNYEESMEYLEEHRVEDRDISNHMLFFRFFREWARRLFYKYERPEIFPWRYLYETVEHYYSVAFEALQRLRQDSAGSFDSVYALMYGCQSQTATSPLSRRMSWSDRRS